MIRQGMSMMRTQTLLLLPSITLRLNGWVKKYALRMSGAFLRSALFNAEGKLKIPFLLYVKEERQRIEYGAAIARMLIKLIHCAHVGKIFLDFPCASGRFAGLPAALVTEAKKYGLRYMGADGVLRAARLAAKRTKRTLKKHGDSTEVILIAADCEEVRKPLQGVTSIVAKHEEVPKLQQDVTFVVADHEQILESLEDGSVAIAMVLEWFLHMEEIEIELFLTRLKEKVCPGGVIFFSVTLARENKRGDFDGERTSLPTRKVFETMQGWKRFRLPKSLSKVRFFSESCRLVGVRPERVCHYVFVNTNV